MSCRQSNMVMRSKSRVGDILGRGGLEADAAGEAVRAGVGVCLLDGRGVEVVADEAAVRESLGHQQGGEADAAADVGHLRARLQARQHAFERRQPGLSNGIDVARPEERADGAEQAAGAVTPGDAAAAAEGGLDLGLALDHGGAEVEGAGEIDRAVLDRKNHRLLRRQAETCRGALVVDVAVGSLGERPFPHVALRQSGSCGEFGGSRGALVMERVEQAQPIADPRRRHAEGAAEIAEHLADQGIEFVVVYCGHRSLLQVGVGAATGALRSIAVS